MEASGDGGRRGMEASSGGDTHIGAELGATAAQGAGAVVEDDALVGLHVEVSGGVDEDELVVQHPVHVLQLDVGTLTSLLPPATHAREHRQQQTAPH